MSSGSIRFLLNDAPVELTQCRPTRTVLQWLREDKNLCGTKEGCAEGDCGACTVVLGEIDPANGETRYRAVNSCIQFLPTLHGKALYTVENLGGDNGELHPVQQSMVDEHGSQCGFCTPGFVMSLYALYRKNPAPTRIEIDEALAGNLCRCTGYRPIVTAATVMHSYANRQLQAREDHDAQVLPEKLQALGAGESMTLTHNGQAWFAPASVDELAALLGEHPDATVLAGGTDIGLWVTRQYRDLSKIIYIGGVGALNKMRVHGNQLEIGAAVCWTDALEKILDYYPDYREMLSRFAAVPIRNAATLAGNIANGSPIGDSMPALITVGARVVLRSGDVRRVLALDEFYIDYQKTELAPGEFVEAVQIPLPEDKQDSIEHIRCYKISKRFDQDISAVCAAFRVRIEDGQICGTDIAFGGVAAIPKRARRCEEALRDQPWSEATIRAAMPALDEDFSPITDMRASSDYRRNVSRNLLLKFYLDANGQIAEPSLYDYGR